MSIPVLPKNYRRIALAAVSAAKKPVILMDGKRIADVSAEGRLTQRGIRSCRNFEIRDGDIPILGFHDHPDEMWISGDYEALVYYCAQEGWLKVQRPAS